MRIHQIEQRDVARQATAVVRSTLPVSEIKLFMGRALGAVAQTLASQGVSPAGPPFARYHRLAEQEFDVEAGFPFEGSVTPMGEVVTSSLPGGPAAVVTYVGPYDEMEAAYGALAEWIASRGGQPAGDPWEVYFTDPAQEPDPQKWCTEIVMPFRT